MILPGLLALAAALVAGGCNSGVPAADEAAPTPEVAVQVAPIIRTNLRAVVRAYGLVEPEPAGGGRPAGAARLMAPAPGIVRSIPVREGDTVQAGDVVVKLDDRAAVAAVELAQQEWERQQKLKPQQGTSEKALQQARQQLAAARAQLAFVQLASPLDGVVARIFAQPGQAVDPSVVVAEIVDPQRLVISAKIPVSEAARVQVGQTAETAPEASAQKGCAGRVAFVSPEADPATDTVLVRVSLPKECRFKPGQFVHLRLVTAERTNRLAVPRPAVYTDNDGHSTVVLVQGNRAARQAVTVGLRDGDWVEITGEGLAEGAPVVTLGSYALPDGAKVKVVSSTTKE